MEKGSVAEVFRVFLSLGCTSFGGPVAHLGYFREAFVVRRQWLSDAEYADIVALCQFLPGPASSQVGMALGKLRAGTAGAVAAFVGFTLPSVLLLLGFAFWLSQLDVATLAGPLHGLKVAALAVVAQAAWGMARTLAPDRERRLIALGAAMVVLLLPQATMQVAVIAAAAMLGALQSGRLTTDAPRLPEAGTRSGAGWVAAFFVLLVLMPILALSGVPALVVADGFYRVGALVFGGGHVVLPLLEAETVSRGLIDRDTFLAGYGLAQAVPGPLFSFAAYLGALLRGPVSGWGGAMLALGAIYLPSFLLVFGVLPVRQRLRHVGRLRRALDCANAAVVGLLLAVLYDPMAVATLREPRDAAWTLGAFAALAVLRLPPALVVLGSALVGLALQPGSV